MEKSKLTLTLKVLYLPIFYIKKVRMYFIFAMIVTLPFAYFSNIFNSLIFTYMYILLNILYPTNKLYIL